MSTVIKITVPGKAPFYRIHVKGASEIVLKMCEKFALLPFSDSTSSPERHPVPAVGSRSNPSHPLLCATDPKDGKPLKDYEALIEAYATQSLRTISLAYRDFTEDEFLAIIHGPLREKVAEARQLEHDRKRQAELSAPTEVLRVHTPEPTSVIIQEPVSDGTTTGEPLSLTPTDDVRPEPGKQPGLLGIPVHKPPRKESYSSTNSSSSTQADARSFESRSSDDLGPVTDEDVLSDPLTRDELCRGLVLAALVGIEDPLRD
ncbi:hypothetical protein HK405_015260, partial [Cladochytrium tenue]